MEKIQLSELNLKFHQNLDLKKYRVVILKDSINDKSKLVYLIDRHADSHVTKKMWSATIENNAIRPIEVNSSNGVKTIPRNSLNLHEWEFDEYLEII